MKLVFLGLSLSSSWGNGHATTYRSLLRALSCRGHDITFLERETPWYGSNRDLVDPDFCCLGFYHSLDELKAKWGTRIIEADAVIMGSYVPEGTELAQWVTSVVEGISAFYDIDTPVTIADLEQGTCGYITRDLIPEFDFYLSFSGGPVLDVLEEKYGAIHAEALYCSVDPSIYKPLEITGPFLWDLGYLGTYSPDRQAKLDELLVRPAGEMPSHSFALAGALYPGNLKWSDNIARFEHISPQKHAAFYSQQRYTLNITRAPMVEMGYSPSIRLFEAAACATPVISDFWEGLDELFVPEEEILIARSCGDVRQFLEEISEGERRSIAERARARILKEHTSDHRAQQLESLIGSARPSRLEPVTNSKSQIL